MSDLDEAYGRYSMVLEWSPQGTFNVATFPELPGRRTHGETPEEAVRQGGDAYKRWVDVAGGRRTVHPSSQPR